MNLNQFSTEKQGNYASLVYRMEPQELYDSLEKGMLENNRIEGLLPISFAQMDDDRFIRYSVTNLITLEEYIKGAVTKKPFLSIILSILNTLETAEEYLLTSSHLLVMEQYIYVDAASSKALMVCLPTESENSWNLSEFFRQLILRANYSNAEGNDYVLYLLRHFNGEADSFNAKVFKEIVKALAKNTKDPAGASVQPVAPMPGGAGQVTPQVTPAIQPSGMVDVKNEKQNEENKKSGWGLFGGQKNPKNVALQSDSVPPVPPTPGPRPQGGMPVPPAPGPRPQGGVPVPPAPGPRPQGGVPVPPAPGPKPPAGAAPVQAENGKKGFFDKLIGKKDKNGADIPVVNNRAPQGAPYVQKPQVDPYVPPVNDGKTVVLGVDEPQATVMLTEYVQQNVYLVRKATGERVCITGNSFAIGRDGSQSDYVISNNPAIGRCHARIVYQGGMYYFIDNNSKNFSYINGAKVAGMQQVELRSGCAIRLANEEFEFVM